MNYDRYYTHDLVNGEGIRVTLFVTGCQHACAGCYNESTWDRKSGLPFTAQIQQKLLDACENHDGLSLSGGDPLHPANRAAILKLCQAFKQRYPAKNIWLWTGYVYEEIAELEILSYVDVVIDGKYEQDKPTSQPWRGSGNQRVIALKPVKNEQGIESNQVHNCSTNLHTVNTSNFKLSRDPSHTSLNHILTIYVTQSTKLGNSNADT